MIFLGGKKKKHKWIPDLIENMPLQPFALHIILGPRQVGKTTLLKLLIQKIEVKREVDLFPGRRGKGKDFSLLPLSFRSFLRVFDKELEKKLPIIKKLTR